jgi:hypothetical protein
MIFIANQHPDQKDIRKSESTKKHHQIMKHSQGLPTLSTPVEQGLQKNMPGVEAGP